MGQKLSRKRRVFSPDNPPAETSQVPAEKSQVPAEKSQVPAETSQVPDETSQVQVPDETSQVPDETSQVPDEKSQVPDETSHVPDERNPMLNHVVLTRIIEFCKVADLKEFRLVCTQWYKLSLDRWRNEMTLNLEPKIFNDLNSVAQLNSEQITEKPYKSYVIRGDIPSSSVFGQPMQKFWEKCGPSVHRLEMDNYIVKEEERVLTKRILCNFSNLEELVVKLGQTSEYGNWKDFEKDSKREYWQPPQNLKSIQIPIEFCGCSSFKTAMAMDACEKTDTLPGWNKQVNFNGGYGILVSLKNPVS